MVNFSYDLKKTGITFIFFVFPSLLLSQQAKLYELISFPPSSLVP